MVRLLAVLVVLAALLCSDLTTQAQSGSITFSITTTTPQSGVAAGTVTHTETFTDNGLINQFGNWILSAYPTCGAPPNLVACPMTGANLNASFQLWAAALVAGTKSNVLRNLQVQAASNALATVPVVQ